MDDTTQATSGGYRAADMLAKTAAQLDDIFTHSPVGPIPSGSGDGVALIAEGTELTPILAKLINHFAWQGKVFDPARGLVLNWISPLHFEAVAGEVYIADSWFDSKPCVVVDYSHTSLINHWVRDELRLVGEGLYLAKTYFAQLPVLHFTLQFH
jgi:hypothetical protein